MKSLKHVRTGGFTLIELMIVVAIIAILAAVAIPNYQDSVRKGRRSAAQTFLLEIANKQQQYLLDRRQYALDAAFVTTLSLTAPSDVTKFYTLTAAVDAALPAPPPPNFIITATPIAGGPQVSDGALTLNSLGAKTRNGAAGW